MDLKQQFNWKKGLRNLGISLSLGIILPYFLIRPFMTLNVFDWNLILTNGILFTIIYTVYGCFDKDTLMHFLIGMGYLILCIYFYAVGNNIYTLFLPHSGFATYHVEENLEIYGQELFIQGSYNYFWFALLLLIGKALNIVRHKIKPRGDKKG